jgi:hypothetical protein
MKKLLMLLAGATLLTPSLHAGDFLVAGRFEYEDKEYDFDGWTGVDPVLPIRGADVYVIDTDGGGVIIGSGTTDGNGNFAISCFTNSLVINMTVRCDAANALDVNAQQFRVMTEQGELYSVFSQELFGVLTDFNVFIGDVTALKVELPAANQLFREGNPFNILDIAVSAWEFIEGPTINAAPDEEALHLFWPGDESYSYMTIGSYNDGYLEVHLERGDGYDDSTELHEIGHAVQIMYSRLKSVGGSHSLSDSGLDIRQAFNEGFATFFSGAVLNSMGRLPHYVSMWGTWQIGLQHHLNLETGFPHDAVAFGAGSEVAVACCLYDIADGIATQDESPLFDDDGITGFSSIDGLEPNKAWWEILVSAAFKDGQSYQTTNEFWDQWLDQFEPDPDFADMQAIFDDRKLLNWDDDQEPNGDFGSATLIPVGPNEWQEERSLYFADPDLAPGTGDEDWYQFEMVIGSLARFQTRVPGPGAQDPQTQAHPYIELYDPSGQLADMHESNGPGRNASITYPIDESGLWRLKVATNSDLNRYGHYKVRADYWDENHRPTIQSIVIDPPIVEDNKTAQITVDGDDQDAGQTLTYHYDVIGGGGSIIGTGSVVDYDPPDVDQPTPIFIEVIVEDNLGAQTDATVFNLLVIEPNCPDSALASTAFGGVPKPGTLGDPAIGTEGAPEVLNPNFVIRFSRLYPNIPGTIYIGFTLNPVAFDDGTIYPSQDMTINVNSGPDGIVDFPVNVTEDFCGVVWYVQGVFFGDPGATGNLQTIQTEYMEVVFGD